VPALELPAPARMCRVAVAAPSAALRRVLVRLAQLATLEPAGELPPPEGPASEALRRVASTDTEADRGAEPALSLTEPDLQDLETRGARDLLAGEVELDRRKRMALAQGNVSVLVGWTPEQEIDELRRAMADEGAALVELRPPKTEIPPTLLRSAKLAKPFRVLVDTYGVLPYSDVDPTAFAAVAFIVMFGMMFGDVGHGALLVLAGLALSRVRSGRMTRVRPSWPLLVGAGGSGVVFGLLYGECFGPTGLVPTLWLAPLEQPMELIVAAIVVGSLLLSVSYLLGSVNRWRERGPRVALYAGGGLAGSFVFAGIAMAVAGSSRANHAATVAGIAAGVLGLVLLFIGALFEAGRGLGGVAGGLVEIMDTVIRIATNVISFSRLAAFGMTHAALSTVTLAGAESLASGVVGWILAALLFTVGTAVALALEGMVAAVQALRLEYYELFSRIFAEEGRPFTPFTIPVRPSEETS
jgi:V/A-type H+-transporting ATPase subunit I